METVLHAFANNGDGQNPEAALIANSNGELSGTTNWGGATGFGAVFKLKR